MDFNISIYALILAQIYSALTLMILFKTFRPSSFLKMWKVARLLYILILLASIFRAIQYWMMMLFNELYLENKLDALSIAVPYNLCLGAYLIIIWIMYTTHDISRLKIRSLSVGNMEEDTFRWLKSTKVTITAVISILFVQVFFYFLYLFQFIEFRSLATQYIGLEGTLGILFFGVYIWIQWIYRGIPYISIEAHRVFAITKNLACVWSVTRSLHLLWYILYISRLTNITIDSIDSGSLESMLELALKLLDKLMSDCLCWYLIADTKYKEIFAKGSEYELNTHSYKPTARLIHSFLDISKSDENSVVSAASFTISKDPVEFLINEECLIYHELYFSGTNKLGDLHLGLYLNFPVLIRRINLTRANKFVIEKFIDDLSFLKRIEYDRIVKISGALVHAPCIEIVMDYHPQGSLFNKLHRSKDHLSIIDRVQIAQEISMIMLELHHKKIYHGHLSPYNILFDVHNNILIADIGLKHLKKYAGLVAGYCNKTCWSSPKVLSENGSVAKNVTKHDDIYSFGILLWEILTGQVPYEGISLDKLKQFIVDGYRPMLPETICNELQTLIKACWSNEPQVRPSFKCIFTRLSNFEDH